MSEDRDARMRERAHALIPGGAHTYAKGDDQYPACAPGFIVRGQGCRVFDLSERVYIEYGMGLRAVTLGHGYEPVIEAACRAMRQGLNFTRPSVLEVEAAETMSALLPPGLMVKFAKNGSDVTTAAVKLARAITGRDLIAICADQPFFSTDDWFIGSTPMPGGIPKSTLALTVRFRFNDLEDLEALFNSHPGKIAAVVLEGANIIFPQTGYLQRVKALCGKYGALFVMDEMINGFRLHIGGAQRYFDVEPDLSTFGKAMSNGFPLAALVGQREFMDRGGLRHEGERIFLLSTTHGAESGSLAAFVATVAVYQREDTIGAMLRQGEKLKRGADQIILSHGLQDFFEVVGHPANLIFVTRDGAKNPSQLFRTLFMQEMITRGILGPSFVISAAHDDAAINQTLVALDGSLGVYKMALEQGAETFLRGPSVKPVFRVRN